MDQISQGRPHAFRKRPKEKNLYSKQHGRHERTLHDPFPDKPIQLRVHMTPHMEKESTNYQIIFFLKRNCLSITLPILITISKSSHSKPKSHHPKSNSFRQKIKKSGTTMKTTTIIIISALWNCKIRSKIITSKYELRIT